MKRLDFEYLKNHNKKVVGKMKCESGGVPIDEFIANGCKSYCFSTILTKVGKENKKCKGITKSVVKSDISKNDYEKAVINGENTNAKNIGIRSYKNTLYTYEIEKVAINAFYDKCIVAENGIDLLPYGYVKKM